MMIAGESFVYFGPEPWEGMWRNRHQLLRRLAPANTVVYVEPRPYIDELTAALRARGLLRAGLCAGGLQPVAERLWAYRTPKCAALGGPPPVRAVTHWLRRRYLSGALSQVGVHRPIQWISTPTQFDTRYDLPARLRVYHIVDDYLGYASLDEAQRISWAERERALIDWADLVVAVTPELAETKGAGNPKFRLLPNAADAAAYRSVAASIPAALAELPRPILGYVGLISVRLDLALLDALAGAHPEWTLALLGEVNRAGCGELLDRLAGRPNVRLLSPVPGDEVTAYVRAFDLGLLPYRRTQETYHASPLKLYEYLAAGLPVVAADVPGARQFADVVALADELPAWEAAIASQLAANSAAAVAARQAAVAPHSWDARVETLSQYLIEALAIKTGENGRPR
jgi:glycosyltransferase involved in cell wall biosynthesis